MTFRECAQLGALLATLLCVGPGCSESNASAESTRTVTAAVGACGKKGLPDCPLQGWMKANLQAYLNSGDSARLATSLDELAAKEPPGFDGWRRSAESAARAARAGDIGAVKAACKQCHDDLRAKFRSELRTTRLF